MMILPEKESYRIGLVSDTHGIVRDILHKKLKDVDLIIHAGDICGTSVLDELAVIAPLEAVRGNMDYSYRYSPPLPALRKFEIGQFRIYLAHDPMDLRPLINNDDFSGGKIAVFGHTHTPTEYHEDGIYFINPGSCGPKRSSRPVKFAIMTLTGSNAAVQFIDC